MPCRKIAKVRRFFALTIEKKCTKQHQTKEYNDDIKSIGYGRADRRCAGRKSVGLY